MSSLSFVIGTVSRTRIIAWTHTHTHIESAVEKCEIKAYNQFSTIICLITRAPLGKVTVLREHIVKSGIPH